MYYQNSAMTEWTTELPSLLYGEAMFRYVPLTTWTVDVSKMTRGDKFIANTKMVDFQSDLSSLNTGSDFSTGCFLNKASVLRICNSLPTWTSGTHPITLGIHIDHKYDEEVLAAIALIDKAQTPVADGGKGWTVVVQWNGTASTAAASTYSWGGRRDPVYAKLAETFENEPPALDWGHYVTNWEENGYMEFASIEEAREYFNITE